MGQCFASYHITLPTAKCYKIVFLIFIINLPPSEVRALYAGARACK